MAFNPEIEYIQSPWNELFDQEKFPERSEETFDSEEYCSTLAALSDARDNLKLSKRLEQGSDCSVTIIVTNYNSGRYLKSSIESLLLQKNILAKILIVDDCSSDKSLENARELAAEYPRVELIECPRNFGTYVAKNIGLSLVDTRYVAFQDADDVSSLRRLEVQFREITSDPDLVAVTTQYCRISETNGQLVKNRGQYCRDGLISLMLDWRRVKESVGFFDAIRVNADDEFKTRIRRVYGRKAIREIDRCMYYAILKENALTTSGPTKNDLRSTNIDQFLAPVRKRYTKSFQRWHKTSPREELQLPFPINTRRFYAPNSISAVPTLEAKRVVIVAPFLALAEEQAAAIRRIFPDVEILAAFGPAERIEFRSLTSPSLSSDLSNILSGHQSADYPRSLLRKEEVVDILGGEPFVFLSGGADADIIPESQLRLAFLFIARANCGSLLCMTLSNLGAIGKLREVIFPGSATPAANVSPSAILYDLVMHDKGQIYFLDDRGLPINA